MLEKGQTPPGIRTDILDEPPNPSAPPPGARMQPRPKPWERANGSSFSAQGSYPVNSQRALSGSGLANGVSGSLSPAVTPTAAGTTCSLLLSS